MTVLDILILNLGFSKDTSEVVGNVQISLGSRTTEYRTLKLKCRCPNSARIRPDALLIGDAVRQLRHLPEIRSGAEYLRFADGLKPLNQTAQVA
ncbi:MAG: hypothetical protein AAGI10_10680 [Pseudomonadota bacterium]